MKNIKYKIEFHSDWHCGSGLAAGADVDALVVRDENGMPFVPGKTIKGLVREAVEEIRGFQKKSVDRNFIKAFGYFDDKEQKEKGSMFFTNAELEKNEYEAIVSNNASMLLGRDVASTAIDEKNGVAKKNSLRKMEVIVPCTLFGDILDVEDEMIEEIEQALKFIKRIGQNRNRGLGRCTIETINE